MGVNFEINQSLKKISQFLTNSSEARWNVAQCENKTKFFDHNSIKFEVFGRLHSKHLPNKRWYENLLSKISNQIE